MISGFKKFLDMVIVLCILTGSLLTGGSGDNDIQKIGENITEGILSGELGVSVSSDIKDPEEIISKTAMADDGTLYFPDIKYDDETRSGWAGARHVGRLEKLVVTYKEETDKDKKAYYLDYINGLLDNWLKNDYQNSNWWYNKLSNPNAFGEIGILLKDELSKEQKIKLAEIVSRGCFTVNHQVRKHTGANAIDLAMSSIKFGVITGSRLAIKDAVKVVSKELNYSDSEGLKSDGTFFQHGNRIYMGGYGITFISGMSNLITMLKGTQYNFTSEQLLKVSNFILDGMRMMSFGNTLDPTTMGRSVSRKNAQPLKGITSTLLKLAKVDEFPRKDEILEFVNSISKDETTDYGLKYFDVAKFVVINNKDFYFSFKGGEKDLVYSEIINDENVLSYNQSFPGVTTIMSTGDEYYNVSPIYDYSYIPGTTAVYETDEELLAHEDFTYRYLDGVYGGKEDNGACVSFAKTTHEGIDMTIACFATDNAAFLLGAGMKDSKGREMNTTLNQTNAAGDFEIKDNIVIANGIKYTVLDGGEISCRNVHRTGSWKRNNVPSSADPVEGDLFTLTMKNKGTYAYSVMSENTNETIEIIRNDEDCQAVVLPDGRVAAAFYTDTSFTYNNQTVSGHAGDAYIGK